MPKNPCAVMDCPNDGRPQTCPYDGRYHHHGHIHYENRHPAHPTLRFRPLTADGWLYVCNEHRAEVGQAVDAWQPYFERTVGRER